MSVTHVVSFSGGRTSAYLVHLMEQRRKAGEDVRYVFMDTGAEHPGTYKFIREVVSNWGIDLICLRVDVNPELGKGNGYKIISIDDIGPDLQPWVDITKKYGTPYFGGAFCTRTMKIEVCNHFCKDNFDNHQSWLGMRLDEPARIWGEKLFHLMRRMNFDTYTMGSLYREMVSIDTYEQMIEMLEARFLLDTATAGRIAQRVIDIRKSKQSFMAEITEFEKEDVLNWWKQQPFDLQIPEHLGNCVFCIKKGLNKVALAMRDEPEMLAQFRAVISSPDVRVVERRQQENKIMYREGQSLDGVEAMYAGYERDDIARTVRSSGGYESGSCTESCEAFIVDNGQLDLFAEQERAA